MTGTNGNSNGHAATTSTSSSTTQRRYTAPVALKLKEYGRSVFKGAVADEYLSKYGCSYQVLSEDPTWVTHSADAVASAVYDWYVCFVCCCCCCWWFLQRLCA
jgi:hypothetical protein